MRARRYFNCGLLIIDEIGFRPLDRIEAVLTRWEAVLPQPLAEPDWGASVAFRFRQRGQAHGVLEPVRQVSHIRWDDLHEIDGQKEKIQRNTEQFVRGRPAKLVHRQVVRFGLDTPHHPGDFGLVTEGGMAWLVRARETDPTIKLKKGESPEIILQRLMPADALRIRGRHNASNALAALALATAIGCPLAPMLHGLREYRGEPHRVEPVAIINGVEYFDDSKGTNVGATLAAINGLGADRRLVVILGGDGKGQDFSPLAAPLARHARAVLLIGRDAATLRGQVAQAVEEAGIPLLDASSLPGAVALAAQQALSGDAVLLSPACASLDMFKDYKHRAAVFVEAVAELAHEQGVELEGGL